MIDNLLDKTFRQQNKRARLTILVSILGVLIFIFLTVFLSFKDKLFSLLYPKPISQAQVTSLENTALIIKDDDNTISTYSFGR